jgi:hypothetical protein
MGSKNCQSGKFMIGQNLLNYEIQEKIGAGGMGEVYRADIVMVESWRRLLGDVQ